MTEQPSTIQTGRFENRPWFWITALTVFGGFFATDHEFSVSTADAFTSTADEMETQAEGGSLKRRISILAIAGLGLLGILVPGRHRFSGITPTIAMMALLVGWCLLSILWSELPSMTLRRCLVLCCLCIGAIGIARQLTFRELLFLAWILPAIGLVIGVFAELSLGTFRPWAGGYRFSGTLHPNTQGESLVAMCLAVFCLARESRWKNHGYLLVFSIGLVFIILTKSRTSFAGLTLAVTLILTLRTASSLKWSVGLAGLWCVTTAAVIVMIFNIDVEQQLTELALMGRQEQAESLTGRVPLWTFLTEFASERPLTGHGFDSFWTPDRIDTVSTELQWGLREAHNAYLEMVLAVGLIGAVLLMAIVLHTLRRAHVKYLQTGHPTFGFLFAMLVFGLLNGFTESGMVMPILVPFLLACGFIQMSMVDRSCTNESLRVVVNPSGRTEHWATLRTHKTVVP